jgi:hypothetical protein
MSAPGDGRDPNPQPPLTPDPPEPTDPDLRAPDLPLIDPPKSRDIPDGTDVSPDAGTIEAPD